MVRGAEEGRGTSNRVEEMVHGHEAPFCLEDGHLQSQFLLGFQTFSVSGSPRVLDSFHSCGKGSAAPWIKGLSRYLLSSPLGHGTGEGPRAAGDDAATSVAPPTRRLGSGGPDGGSYREREEKEAEQSKVFVNGTVEKHSSGPKTATSGGQLPDKRDDGNDRSRAKKAASNDGSEKECFRSCPPPLDGCEGETREEEPAYRQVVSRFQELKRLRHPHLCAYTHILRKADRFFVVGEHWSLSLADIVHQRETQLRHPEVTAVSPALHKERAEADRPDCKEESSSGEDEGLGRRSSQGGNRKSFSSCTSSSANASSSPDTLPPGSTSSRPPPPPAPPPLRITTSGHPLSSVPSPPGFGRPAPFFESASSLCRSPLSTPTTSTDPLPPRPSTAASPLGCSATPTTSASLSLLPESFLRRLAREVLSALIFLNENGLTHLRLCPSTVLFDGSGHVRLAEWGLSHLTAQGLFSPHTNLFPSPPFLNPQQALVGPDVLSVSSPCAKHDTWALGAVLLYAMQGPCRMPPSELYRVLVVSSCSSSDVDDWDVRMCGGRGEGTRETDSRHAEELQARGVEAQKDLYAERRPGSGRRAKRLEDREEDAKAFLRSEVGRGGTGTGTSDRPHPDRTHETSAPGGESRGKGLLLESEEGGSIPDEVKEKSTLSIFFEAEDCVWDDWRGCEAIVMKAGDLSAHGRSEGVASAFPENFATGRETKVLPKTHPVRTLREVERLALMLLYVHWAYEAHSDKSASRHPQGAPGGQSLGGKISAKNFSCIGRALERRLRQKKFLLLAQMKYLIKATCCFVEPAAYEALLSFFLSPDRDSLPGTRHADGRQGEGEAREPGHSRSRHRDHPVASSTRSLRGRETTSHQGAVSGFSTQEESIEDCLLWAILSWQVSWLSGSRCLRSSARTLTGWPLRGVATSANVDPQAVEDFRRHPSSASVSADATYEHRTEGRREGEKDGKNCLSSTSSVLSSSSRTSSASSQGRGSGGLSSDSSSSSSGSSLASRFSGCLPPPCQPRASLVGSSPGVRPRSSTVFSQGLTAFLEGCLRLSPESRLSPAEARGLAWFSDENVEDRFLSVVSPVKEREHATRASESLPVGHEERRRPRASLSEGFLVEKTLEKEAREEHDYKEMLQDKQGREEGRLWCPRSAEAAKILLELEVDAEIQKGNQTRPLSATSLNLKDFLFRYHNVPLDEIFFWWQLKGGDVHATLVERGAFRPVPPILRLPLCCLLRPASSSPALLQPEASSSAPVASLTETRHSPGVHADSTVALGGKAHPREAHSWSDASTRLNVSGRVAGAAAFAPAAAQGAELGVGLTQQSPEDLERVPLLASMLDLRQLHSISDLHRGRPPELAESQGQASVCACQKLQAYGCQILQSASLQPLKGNARGPCTGRQRESHSPPSQERHRQRGELVVGDSPSDFPWERTPSARLPSADSRTGICGGTTSPCSRLSGRQSALEFPPTKDKGRGLLGGPQLPAEEMNGFPGRGIEGPTEEEELQGRTLEGLGVVSECSFFSTGFGKGRSWRDVDIPWIEGDARIRGVSVEDTVTAIQEADRFPMSQMHEVRPRCLYMRQFHFLYQRLRVRLFRSLLAQLPKSRSRLTEEAGVDIPPLLRPQIWATLLGVNFTAEVVAGPFVFDQLVVESLFIREAQQLRINEFSQCHEYHDLLGSRFGRRQLRRLLQALLAQAHSTTSASSPGSTSPPSPSDGSSSLFASVRGLDAIAAPFQLLYADHPQVALACLQQVLVQRGQHQLFGPDNAAAIHEQLACFSQLLHFVDPLLAIHLTRIGLHPDMYALSWILTLFSHALELPQLFLLWDSLLLQPPSFTLFVAVCLLHHLRGPLLQLAPDEESCALALLRAATAFVHVPSLCCAAVALQDAAPVSVAIPFVARKLAGHFHDSDKRACGANRGGVSRISGGVERRRGEQKLEQATGGKKDGETNGVHLTDTDNSRDEGGSVGDEDSAGGQGQKMTKNFYIGDDGDEEQEPPSPDSLPALLKPPQSSRSSQGGRGARAKESGEKKRTAKSFMASMMLKGPALMLMGPPRKANRPLLFQEANSDGPEAEEERRISDPLEALMDEEDEEGDRWWEATGAALLSPTAATTERPPLSTSANTGQVSGVLSSMLARGSSSPPLLTVDDLLEHRDTSTVLDVRTSGAFAKVHFLGSKNVASDAPSTVLASVLSAAAKAAASMAAYFPDSFPGANDLLLSESETTAGESRERVFSERFLHSAPPRSTSASTGGGGSSGASTPFSSRLLQSGRQRLLPSSTSASSTASTASSVDPSVHSVSGHVLGGETVADVRGSSLVVKNVAVAGGGGACQDQLSQGDAESQYQRSQNVLPWIRSGMSTQKLHLVVVTGSRADPGLQLAARLQRAGVLHVCVLLGGIDAILADAPSCFVGRG